MREFANSVVRFNSFMALTIGINASLKDLPAGGKSLVILLAITIPLSALKQDAVAQPYR